jgi:hypothetical protein
MAAFVETIHKLIDETLLALASCLSSTFRGVAASLVTLFDGSLDRRSDLVFGIPVGIVERTIFKDADVEEPTVVGLYPPPHALAAHG